ncbi:V-type proton ATPase 116 kDa subunit a1-like isoform X2 [Saccostrea echinata]|uniref:V-type proton ATPase 116 kDa subunit a1-like isoform X2 n=1 Tax=Saccostrea echinata TaxID=191078 RepID=UPI002A80C7BE|nr:V-type proton ATPase 116 kDa subunit a1-like isoform X2 [Saccostrea echinata]XP_061191485.1 V-type proton ATPase 116 kDa subunit a1-like isoform X2 [Saccostrea echinata]
MGALFRSEEMNLCQIFLQSEAAYACVSELGELGLVQFKDLNPDVNAFQRKFVSEIMRCEEMERKLRYIHKELKKDGMKIPDRDENPKAPAPKEMIDLEATFEKIESELKEVNTNAEALRRNYLELTELKEVLKKTQLFFSEHGRHGIVEDAQSALVHDEGGGFVPITSVQLGFVAGVIPREKVPAFERLLWFANRGNTFLKYDEIEQALEDPVTGDAISKCVFLIFFQGEQLKARVRKICEGFKATLYPCPESAQERIEMLNGVSTRLEDLNTVLHQTEDHRKRVLMSAQKEIRPWIIKVKKIKAIYHTLNMCNFDVSHNSLIAECWTPVSGLEEIQRALKHGTELSGSTVPSILHRMQTKEVPPTYFRTNKFTLVFQEIIDAYGIASYQEVNPAPYAIISFPFLFAVMFGDFGHGFIMFLAGLWMVIMEKKLMADKSDNEIRNMFFGGRYIITMMGLFSVYTGLIYNDIFSKSVNIFGSAWHPNYDFDTLMAQSSRVLDPLEHFDNATGPYPFGVDPIWQGSLNKITFTNSLKMKISVIFGVSQMLLGVLLSCVNHAYFRRPLNIFCEFIPQLVFLLCLFGYLVALVFYKWIFFTALCTQYAPQLLIQFINMFLITYTPRSKPANFTGDLYACSSIEPKSINATSQTVFFEYQQPIQITLVVLALSMVPMMLLVKPFILRARHNARVKRRQGLYATSQRTLINNEEPPDQSDDTKKGKGERPEAHLSDIELGVRDSGKNATMSINGEEGGVVNHTEGGAAGHEEEEEEKFEMGEVFIHQAIHTIEYCLGCISHTASYLRLWALSLAHAQLSEVLWGMLFHISLTMKFEYVGGIIIWAVFAVFAAVTVAVLLLMEGLSAFLHTLRLHWVEFNSKFYMGEGYKFAPYSFKHLLDADLDD